MHIAFVTTEFVTDYTFAGGLANYIHRTSISLNRIGIKVTVFVDSLSNESINFEGITVIRVKPKKTWWYWLINFLTFFRFNPVLLSIVRSYRLKESVEYFSEFNKIDLVQYSTTRSVGILTPKDIPCVIRISSYQKLLDQANGDKQTFRLWQKQYLQDIMLKRSVNIFGPSKIIGNYIAKKFNKNVSIIESPFTLDNQNTNSELLNEILEKSKGNPYLLYFGSLSQLKGLLDLSLILEKFFQENPNFYFVFIGKDIPVNGIPIVNILKAKAGNYSNRIIWYFSSPHSLLYPVVNRASMVVLPSRLDNFPNTCIEAMAFGKVVIGTYKTSFEQLIENKVSGILCEHSNPKSLLDAINYGMKLSESEKKEMGLKAQARIEKLKPEIVVKQLLDYYNSIIKE